jgi:hypothetical protein
MMHAYVFEDSEMTAQRIDELLTLYPRSSVAYEIKARMAVICILPVIATAG